MCESLAASRVRASSGRRNSPHDNKEGKTKAIVVVTAVIRRLSKHSPFKQTSGF